MGIFQSSILRKHLANLDQKKVSEAWEKFKLHFQNTDIQRNIQNSKEEQYAPDFLTELFVNVLGYTKNPTPKFNLTTELKNIRDAKKTDGAILKNGNAIAVIELKGMNTVDLKSVENQAFGYKNNQPNCLYVITSNFEKLRFYIHNAVDFEEFNLFKLTKPQFEILWLCLSASNLLENIPQQLKEESISEDHEITSKFYAKYSRFRTEIFNDIVKRNSEYDKLTLFNKTQKLLDKFLFYLFAQNKGLIPTNSVQKIINEWTTLQDLDDKYQLNISLYGLFNRNFQFMNTGYQPEIYPYNGGLFAPDEVLDSIKIDDGILYKHTWELAKYYYESNMSVNILGHIFEHSLSEIEEMQAQIKGESIDKNKSKRKKDGVFYTPKYITKYIVDNTIGKLCEEKKIELQIHSENSDNQNITLKLLENYRSWLLELTICDPACGSGAFLNQALEFLINEHQYIDEWQLKLGGKAFENIENVILNKNLFGVDINGESVEITKLSLWLNTAQKGKKLTALSDNIKCGNSLIDDPEIAGNKAFNWENEFPKVFENGGFDVVIGNPPYVRQELVKHYHDHLINYNVFSGKADLYTYFYEQGFNLLKNNGLLSFISSGKFFEANYGKTLVEFLTTHFQLLEIIDFYDLEIFTGISAYPLIFLGRKNQPIEYTSFNYTYVPKFEFNSVAEFLSDIQSEKILISDFKTNEYKFLSTKVSEIFSKINTNATYLKDSNLLPLVGVKTGYNDGFILAKNSTNLQAKGYIFGKNLKRYIHPDFENKIAFPYHKRENLYELLPENELQNLLIEIEPHKEKLEKRAIIKEGIRKGNKKWFEYQQINKNIDFDKEYIVYPNVSLGNNFTLSKGNVIDMTGFVIASNDKTLLGILNSKLTKFIMGKLAITRRGGYQEYKVQYLEKIPIKKFKKTQNSIFRNLVNQILSQSTNLNNHNNQFLKFLTSKFEFEKVSRKLQNWEELDEKIFLKELKKAKITLNLSEESEWMSYFESQKEKSQIIKNQILMTDKEIDQMVYKLYDLTDEEIAIVEAKPI